MANNLEAMKALLEKKNTKQGQNGDVQYLKLDKGEWITIRFIPITFSELDAPFAIENIHYIDKKYITCDGKGCKHCQLATEAWKEFKSTNNEDYKELFKQLVKSERFVLLGFNPNDANSPLYKVSTQNGKIKEMLTAMVMKNKDFTDFESGRNFTIKRNNDQMGTYSWLSDDPTPVADSIAQHYCQIREDNKL